MNTPIYQTLCRSCRRSSLTPVLSLGTQYVSDFVPEDKIHCGIPVPISLDLCRDCGLVQQQYTAPSDLLYRRQYWYRSGVTYTMRMALRAIVERIESLVSLRPCDVVLDIGSNDGTLLRAYSPLTSEIRDPSSDSPPPSTSSQEIIRVGFEPAKNLEEMGRVGVNIFVSDFWNKERYELEVGRKAKVITAIGMLYDLDDPNKFLSDVSDCLADDGLFVAQLMCLRQTLSIRDVGNFSHEHLEFYSLRSLIQLFRRNGLWVFGLESNEINGGSYRIFARKVGGKLGTYRRGEEDLRENLNTAIAMEDTNGYTDPKTYQGFRQEINLIKSQILSYIDASIEEGKKVWVYGASTKGNVILQWLGLDRSRIIGAADRSPEKWGLYTIETGIPIRSEEDARAARPDIFLVLPYAFISEFVLRESEFLKRGGVFLVPFPFPHILSSNGDQIIRRYLK